MTASARGNHRLVGSKAETTPSVGEANGGGLYPGTHLKDHVDATLWRGGQALGILLPGHEDVLDRLVILVEVAGLRSHTLHPRRSPLQRPGCVWWILMGVTGGLAPLILAESETLQYHEPHLTLIGLRLVFAKNT